MTILTRCFLTCLCCLVLAGSAFGQVSVIYTITQTGLEIFFLKDFDINNPGNGAMIFTLTVTNTTSQTQNVRLQLDVGTENQGQLSSGTTGTFAMQPNQMLMLTNNDLFTNVGPYRLVDYRVDDNLVDELLKDILATGKLPTDIYRFRAVALVDGAPSSNGPDVFEIRLTNPRKLDLIFPGSPATGRLRDVQKIFTPLPFFRLESDMRRFRVIVAEARPGEDPESALNQEPRFVKNFVVDPRGMGGNLADFGDLQGRVDILPSPAFQYPASGTVLSLRPGKVYYWRAIGFIRSSSGPVPLESEIYAFRIAALDQVVGGDDQIQIVLRALLGNDYQQLFGEDGELEAFLPQRVMFEGKEITPTELLTRLRKLRNSYKGYSIEN